MKREKTTVSIQEIESLELQSFKEMDYYAVEEYGLPIELMMENAGLQLARLIADSISDFDQTILIGVGNGNNGGGGLVAARRLAAWGYMVYLDFMTGITKELPKRQLERAIKFGVSTESIKKPDVWVDAYLGFSQRLPLSEELTGTIQKANACNCLRISLDIPTGYLGDQSIPFFKAHKILTLAALKKILIGLNQSSEIYIADLGIPQVVYNRFGIEQPNFKSSTIIQLI